MNNRKFLLALCLTCVTLLATSTVFAAKQDHVYQIGVAGSAPFVVDTQQQTGISLEIWQAMSNQRNMDYQLISYQDAPSALSDLDSGKLDAVVGPLSITSERAELAKFTQPYYQSSLSIMSRIDAPTIWERIKPFFSVKFYYAVFVFLCILFIVGLLLWITEREHNPDEFPKAPAKGIANGMWCAIVTMSTTGYGDRSPRTFWGRIIAGAWMIISMIFTTAMIAGIASFLTLSGFGSHTITEAKQLANKKVAVVKNSPAATFVTKYGADKVYFKNLDEAYKDLKDQTVDAIVFDRPQLLYYQKNHKDDDIMVSHNQYVRQGYGFAVPLDSHNLHEIDISLLKLQESGRVNRIINSWLGEHDQ